MGAGGLVPRLSTTEFSFRVDGLLQNLSEDGGGDIAALSPLGFLCRLRGSSLDGAPQSPAALHPIASLGHGPGGVMGEIAVLEAVGKNHAAPGAIVLPRQPTEIAEELGVGGARLFGLVDHRLQLVDEFLLAPGPGS